MTSAFCSDIPTGHRLSKESSRSDHLNPVWKAGRTRDLSVDGILVDIPEALPVGSAAELVMDRTG
jgi:hypothetical protein